MKIKHIKFDCGSNLEKFDEEKLLNITDLTHIIFKLNKYRLFIE